MNDAKINDLTKRMLKLSTTSNMTIAEVAACFYNCLAGLALEASGGDKDKAAKLIRESIEDLALRLESPGTVAHVVVENGKVVAAK